MTYKEVRTKLKEENKQFVTIYTKEKRSGQIGMGGPKYMEARSKHIAWAMFKGKTFEQIEAKWKEPTSWLNKRVKDKALQLLASYQAMVTTPSVAPEGKYEVVRSGS